MGFENAGMNRAEFFGSIGALALTLSTGGCEQIAQGILNRPTRRDITKLATNDPILQVYREAISLMQAKHSSDPLSWSKQADIHKKHCPHGNWWFFPWHAAYLTYFERTIQTLCGDTTWALPYWNWTTDNTCPAVFYNNDPMHDKKEGSTPPTELTEFVGHTVLEGILSQPNFETFAGMAAAQQRDYAGPGGIEATPHNYVHSSFPDNGDMYFVEKSARNPVFWCHHAMVDYCWVDWQFARGNANTSDPTWANLNFTEFFDQSGKPLTVQAGMTPLFAIFDYQYEPSQIGGQIDQIKGVKTKTDADRLKAVVQKGLPSKIDVLQRFHVAGPLQVSAGAPAIGRVPIVKGALVSALSANSDQRAILRIVNVEPPAKADVFVRVFVNTPGTISDQTPITDPHYAGSFAFFLHGDDVGMAMPSMQVAGFQVDITDTLRRIGVSDSLDIQLVAVAYPGRLGRVSGFKVGAIELDIARAASSVRR